MWRVKSVKVVVYKTPGINAKPISELVLGDTIADFIPGFFSKGKTRDGILWIKVKLINGSRGYVNENILVESIGDGPRLCPTCGHVNSADCYSCTECKRNFKSSIYNISKCHDDLKAPKMCIGCCNTTSLHEHPVKKVFSYTKTHSGTLVSVRWTFTETLIINAFICDECKQIYEAERSYEKKITRNAIVTLLFCFSILLLAALAFAIFVLRANSNNIPIFFIYMSAILIIGIMLFLLIRNIKVKKEKTTRPHVDLIKKYQHPCQPVLIDRMQKEDDWTLRIYNEQYADAFEKMNMGNHGLTKISH